MNSLSITTPEQIQKSIASGSFLPNIYLTNLLIAYFQDPADYGATRLFPVVPVELSASHYYVFDKASLARDDVQRKPAFGKVAPTVYDQSEDTYSCKVEQIILGLDQLSAQNYTRAGAPGAIDPRRGKIEVMNEKINIHLDNLFAKKYFKSGIWSNELTGVSASPSDKQFIQFDNANSDPIALFDELKTKIKREGRRAPNKLGLGVKTYDALKNHPMILERVKYSGSSTNPATINEKVLAELFGLKEAVVLSSTYNAAKEGQPADMQYICEEDGALLLYAPDAPTIDTPSAGYIFAWDILGGGQFAAVSTWEGEKGTHSEFIEGLMANDMKITCQDLACYLSKCVG